MPTAAARWKPIVQRARQSGLSIRAFARQQGLNPNTLASWSWKLQDSDEGSANFVEVTVAEASTPVRLRIGQVIVEVEEHTDLALLRRVVEVLV